MHMYGQNVICFGVSREIAFEMFYKATERFPVVWKREVSGYLFHATLISMSQNNNSQTENPTLTSAAIPLPWGVSAATGATPAALDSLALVYA